LSDIFKYPVVYALVGTSESHKTNKMLGLRVTSPLLLLKAFGGHFQELSG